jgi:signal transduction histidine kinase
MVQLHGGEASAASPGEGRGATFTVRLPLAQRSGQAHAGPAAL